MIAIVRREILQYDTKLTSYFITLHWSKLRIVLVQRLFTLRLYSDVASFSSNVHILSFQKIQIQDLICIVTMSSWVLQNGYKFFLIILSLHSLSITKVLSFMISLSNLGNFSRFRFIHNFIIILFAIQDLCFPYDLEF